MNIDDLFEKHSVAYYDANEAKTEVLTKRRFERAVAEIEQQLFVEQRQNEMLIKECEDLTAENKHQIFLNDLLEAKVRELEAKLKYEKTYDETKKA